MAVRVLVQSRLKPFLLAVQAMQTSRGALGWDKVQDLLKQLVFHRADCLGKAQQQKPSRQHGGCLLFREAQLLCSVFCGGSLPAACNARGLWHPRLLPGIKQNGPFNKSRASHRNSVLSLLCQELSFWFRCHSSLCISFLLPGRLSPAQGPSCLVDVWGSVQSSDDRGKASELPGWKSGSGVLGFSKRKSPRRVFNPKTLQEGMKCQW